MRKLSCFDCKNSADFGSYPYSLKLPAIAFEGSHGSQHGSLTGPSWNIRVFEVSNHSFPSWTDQVDISISHQLP